jgi:hypothetical protein
MILKNVTTNTTINLTIAHMLGMSLPPPTLPSKALGGGPSKHDLFGGKEKVSTFRHTLYASIPLELQQLLSHVK